MDLHRHVRSALATLPTEAGLLVAVSGGQDSLCLLKLLVDLNQNGRWHLHVGHLDHRWRPDSQVAARTVARLSATWRLPFHLAVAREVPASEAAARAWRYAWLEQTALGFGLGWVLTAHTRSDRAETFLFNLLRGSGTAGLASLDRERPLGRVRLLRPLLSVGREQTGTFCQMHQLPVALDATNQDLTYRRNRIRLELLPYLREHFNPQVETTLVQAAEILKAESDYLEAQAEAQRAVLVQRGRLHRWQLASLPLALQRRIVRQWLAAGLGRPPRFAQVEAVLACLSAPRRTRTTPLALGMLVEVQDDWLALVPERPQS